MGTDIEKLVDLMIQERMQSQFAKWREAETGKEKKADYLRLETEYEKAISVLSEEQKDAVRHYCDSIFDSGAESECFFYPQTGRKPSNGTGWAAFSLPAFLPLGRIVRLRLGLPPHVVGIFEHLGQAQYPKER